MEGRIVKWIVAKLFGFIQPDGGGEEIFVHRSAMTDGQTPGDGDRISFEVEPGPKGPRAKDARIIERNPNPPQPQPRQPRGPARTPAPQPPPPPPPAELAVEIRTRGCSIIQHQSGARKKEQRLSIPVWVEVTRDNKPVVGQEVTLDADGQPVVQFVEKVCTGKKGLAFFHVNLAADKTSCFFVAHVAGKDYSAYWDKALQDAEAQEAQALATTLVVPPTPPETPKVAKAIRVFELGMDEQGFACFRVITQIEDRPDADGALAEYSIESADALEDKDCDPDTVEDVEPLDTYTSDEQGQDIVRVRPKTAAEATVHFRLAKFPTKPAGPFRVKRKVEAKPAEPPKVEPKLAGYIKADALVTDGNWTLIRVYTAISKDAEGVKSTVIATNIGGIEVESVDSGSMVSFDTEDNGFVLHKVRLQKPGKAKVVFELKHKPSIEDSVEIETKGTPACKRIKAEVEMGRPGFHNILKIHTQVGENPTSEGIATEVVVENLGTGEIIVGSTQGRAVALTTDAKGKATRTVFFVAPEWCGDVVVYSTADPNVRTEAIYIRHPENATRP